MQFYNQTHINDGVWLDIDNKQNEKLVEFIGTSTKRKNAKSNKKRTNIGECVTHFTGDCILFDKVEEHELAQFIVDESTSELIHKSTKIPVVIGTKRQRVRYPSGYMYDTEWIHEMFVEHAKASKKLTKAVLDRKKQKLKQLMSNSQYGDVSGSDQRQSLEATSDTFSSYTLPNDRDDVIMQYMFSDLVSDKVDDTLKAAENSLYNAIRKAMTDTFAVFNFAQHAADMAEKHKKIALEVARVFDTLPKEKGQPGVFLDDAIICLNLLQE